MQKHTLTFDSFQDKHIAIDWLREQEMFDDLDECLTEKRCVFFTGIELTKRQAKQLKKAINVTSYSASDC